MVEIYCKNTGTSAYVQEGSTILETLSCFDFERPYPILAAKVNNILEGLTFKVYNSREVEFLDYRSYAGRSAYCRSLCFLLSKACQDLYPGCRLTMRRPISKGYFCSLERGDGSAVSEEDVALISAEMRRLVDAAFPFHRREMRLEDALDLFSSLGQEDKVKLLSTSESLYVQYYTLDGTVDSYYDALVPSTSYLKVWELMPFRGGMLLRVPDRHDPDRLAPFYEQPKTFDVLNESTRWNSFMGLESVGDVNKACIQGRASELIKVSEALQDKKIVQIADEIERRFNEGGARLVLITGPSSSGKTTVCKKLSIQLKACGLHPVSFSTDDYFVNRVDTPKLPDGNYDFDNFDTVDHDALQRDIISLFASEEVEVPEYNFVTGIREYNGKTLKMESRTVLIVEGIHALNPMLTDQLPEDKKYRIFINAVTSIPLDDHNSIPTSDNRLLRRIIRDYNCGAFTAVQTISNWPNVRRAEGKWIYPYQETADVLYNSSYLIEFAVLRNHAERVLATVPRNAPEYSEAFRLLKFLQYFTPVPDKEIPPTSLLREFVGGSSFKY